MIERFFHEVGGGDSDSEGGREGEGEAWVDERPTRAKVRSPRFHRCVGYKRLLGYLPGRQPVNTSPLLLALPPHELKRH